MFQCVVVKEKHKVLSVLPNTGLILKKFFSTCATV